MQTNTSSCDHQSSSMAVHLFECVAHIVTHLEEDEVIAFELVEDLVADDLAVLNVMLPECAKYV